METESDEPEVNRCGVRSCDDGTLANRQVRGCRAAATAGDDSGVVYPAHEGARFDIAYYRANHIPLAMKVMRAERVTLIEGVPTGDAAPPYAMIAHFQFSSPEALQRAVAGAAMADVRADVATFTDIRPIVMFAR